MTVDDDPGGADGTGAPAAGPREPEVTRLLLEQCIHNESGDRDGRTALMLASADQDPRTVLTLLRLGADPRSRDRRGWTPLRYAVAYNDPVIVELLIKYGAEVDATDALGRTPLMTAAAADDLASLDVLLSAGANPDRFDYQGWKAADFGVMESQPASLALPLERHACHPDPRVRALYRLAQQSAPAIEPCPAPSCSFANTLICKPLGLCRRG